MLMLDAYSTAALQHCREILAQALADGMSIADLDIAMSREISARVGALQKYPIQQRQQIKITCHECGRGVIVDLQRVIAGESIHYYACVNRQTGKTGCGWSKMVENGS